MKTLKFIFISLFVVVALVACDNNKPEAPYVPQYEINPDALFGTWKSCYRQYLISGGLKRRDEALNQELIFTRDSMYRWTKDGEIRVQGRFRAVNDYTLYLDYEDAESDTIMSGEAIHCYTGDTLFFGVPDWSMDCHIFLRTSSTGELK